MDFLRLHLPGLHQALRGTLDSISTFVSYLLGDEVPTAERREAWAAEALGEVAAGRRGSTVEEEAQEALEGVGSSQSQGDGGLRGPGEARLHQEGSSATEQTWSWGDGSSQGSQGDRQDSGVWEATKASRCQEPRAPLEARKKSEAESESGGDRSSQAQENQEYNEQEENREETLRTWEQGEEVVEEEEVRTREPGGGRGVESGWIWHREPEGKAGAHEQKAVRDDRDSEQTVKEAAAEEIQEASAKEAGREEEVVAVVRDGQSARAQGTQEPGAEFEDGATLGREEVRMTSDRREAWTISAWEEAGATSGQEECRTISGREEARTTLGREEAWITSSGEEAWTTSGQEECRTISGQEEAQTTLGREEAWITSGGEEAWTTSAWEEAGATSGQEEGRTTSSREKGSTTSGQEECRTISDQEEARTTLGREEAWITSGGEEGRTTASREEGRTTLGQEEAWTTSAWEEGRTVSGQEEGRTTSSREEGRTTSGWEETWTVLGRQEVGTTSGRKEAGTTFGREEATASSGGGEGRINSGIEAADLPGVRETEYGAVPGNRSPEGTGSLWALEEASKGAQEEEVGENREAEVSLFPKQTQALRTEGMGGAAKGQTAGKEDAESQASEWGAGEGFEGRADQDGKGAKGRQDSEVGAAQARLEEVVQAQEAEEKEGCRDIEAEFSQDKVANEAEGDADFEAILEASPEKEFKEKSEEEAQMGREELGVECGGPEHKVTEVQELGLIGGLQTPVEPPEEGQVAEDELWSTPALGREETEGSLEASTRPMGCVKPGAEAWGSQRKGDVERGIAQEEKVVSEEGAEEAAGGRESALPQVPEAGTAWEEAKEAGCGAGSQELGGRHGAEGGTGQSVGESDARDATDEEAEAAVPWEAGGTPDRVWRPEEAALSFQDSEDTRAGSLAAEVVENKAASDENAAGTGEGPEREAGEAWDGAFGRGWDSEGREAPVRGEELMEAAEGENRGGQELGLESSAEEEVTGRGGQVEAFEAREGEPGVEWVEVGEFVVAEEGCGTEGFTLGSQVARAEGTMAIVEAEGLPEELILLEKEAGIWQAREQGQNSEGQCGDHSPEGDAQMPCDMEDAEVTRHQRAEAEEIDAKDPEDFQGQEGQSTNQDPEEAEPGLGEEAAGSAGGDAQGIWSEALLPVSRLDVSVPRSRVLLSRSSSQRRSRPSFRRIPTPEQQKEPASPPPEEELSAPEQRLLQPEEPPEPSPPRPEGTPVPARRRPLGYGFGLAHSGMMQELQTRLGRPKPQ
ncbi:apolipoprotein B receptor [Molossus nigricans]